MAKTKKMIKEIKTETHKLTTEGVISVNEDNTIEVDIPEEGVKTLSDLIKNFSGEYVKITIQTDTQEDID